MPWRSTEIFKDPTPDGYINQRYVLHLARLAQRHTDMTPSEFNDFMPNIALVAKKLTAVWLHRKRYCEIEDQLIADAKANPPFESLEFQQIGYSQDLFLEMDEFLYQVKSTLDYLVKLPRSIIGRAFPYLHTFGDKGGAVIKAMKANIPKKWAGQSAMIQQWIIEEHRPWLEMAIEARDKMTHFKDGGLDPRAFLVIKRVVDGQDRIEVPRWVEELTARDYLEHTWFNLFAFTEQFTAGFLIMRLKPGLGFVHVPQPKEGIESPAMVGPEHVINAIIADYNRRKGTTTETIDPSNY